MTCRTLRSGILAIGSAILCLSASSSGAGDAKTAQKDDAGTRFREAVLERFDTNHNGRLDAKEKAAALRALTGRDQSDAEVNALRTQILARFDKNGNGKLERQEVRTALATVNLKSQPADGMQPSTAVAATGTPAERARIVAEIVRDPSSAVAFTAQQLTSTGVDASIAQELAIQKFDLNGDGVLDTSELALAQAALLQQLAQAAATTSTLQTTPLATTVTTGTTGTTTTGTTGTTGSMSGGCSGGTSGTSGSSTGTTGTTGSSGTTNSAAQAANNQAFGNPSFAAARSRGFGGGRGR
jgi:Ca2+-binding EF-hand superfamily protein